MCGIAAVEMPAVRAPRSCLKRGRNEDSVLADLENMWEPKRATTTRRRVRLASTISVGFVCENEADADADEHQPCAAAQSSASRRSSWLDEEEETDETALHDGPSADSLIISMLVQTLASSMDPTSVIPILSVVCQQRSAKLYRRIQDRLAVIKARIASRGTASLLPANVTLNAQSVPLLSFISESVLQASSLLPCNDEPATTVADKSVVVADGEISSASCAGEIVHDDMVAVPVMPQMPC